MSELMVESGSALDPASPAVARRMSQLLGEPVALAVATDPRLDPRAADRRPLTEVPAAEFRIGRAALGQVMHAVAEPGSARAVQLPHPRLSLTHSHGVAVAAGLGDHRARGCGIDVELVRAVDPRTARFFLDEGDRRRWLSSPDAGDALPRLWTAKEAVFKSDLDNAGRLLRHYQISEVTELAPLPGQPDRQRWWSGRAGRGPLVFRFVTVASPAVCLSLAVPERN